jgi:hypothetical protein
MRRQLVSLSFAALATLAAVSAAALAAGDEQGNAGASARVQLVRVTGASVREAISMILVGSALIVLAARLRRSF